MVTVFSFVSVYVLGLSRFPAFAPVADGFVTAEWNWEEVASFLSLLQRHPTFAGTRE